MNSSPSIDIIHHHLLRTPAIAYADLSFDLIDTAAHVGRPTALPLA